MTFDTVSELKAQYKRTGKDPTGIDWGRVENLDTLYISSLFDSVEWWKQVGRKDHPQVFPVFPAVIAQPASNDFQERIFSACTWFDNPLRQSLQDERFEMAVLLAVNESFLDMTVPSDARAREIVASVLATFERSGDLFDPSFGVASEDFITDVWETNISA